MDNTDKKLVSILFKDGRTSLSAIGEFLKMTHVAVKKRLDKLINSGQIKVTAGVSPEALDMKMLFIAIETKNNEISSLIIEKYQDCPRLLIAAPVTGRYNLFVVMIVEDSWTLESIIGSCNLRLEEGVLRSETWFGNAPITPGFIPIDLAPKKDKKGTAPCGVVCQACRRYKIDKCVGCPVIPDYKGTLW